jgi:acyl carrier protein
VGRSDDQVQVRGARVEPTEVEDALARHPLVSQAAVVAEEADGTTQLVAHVVREPGAAPSATELRRFLLERLPAFMLPSRILLTDALPTTPSGKVDRRALRTWRGERAASAAPFVSPRTAIERAVADIWTEVLHAERVGVHENFFDLGGHSLLATQVTARLQKTLGVELPLRQFFEEPTVEGIARAVEAMRTAGKPVAAAPIARLSREQYRMPITATTQPGSPPRPEPAT